MAGISVTEKEHWKERIAKRIDKRIEAIAAADPSLIDRVRREARKHALLSLGIAKLQAQLDTANEEKKALERRQREIRQQMLAQIRGIPVEEITISSLCYSEDLEINQAVQRRSVVHEDELLGLEEAGKEILKLKSERENLIDTVWLASSPRQLKELWAKVGELLGEEPTPLQKKAMAIEPSVAGKGAAASDSQQTPIDASPKAA